MRVVAVPVKALDRTKSRLSSLLSPEERAHLALAMLEDVLDACLTQDGPEVWVISRATEVLQLAKRREARPLREVGSTLLQAIRQLEAESRRRNCTELAVVLADLPFLTGSALAAALSAPTSVVAAPAISDGGTNVLVRRPPAAIPARFGRSSFEKHRVEAYRRGLTFQSIGGSELGFDLDREEDLAAVLETQNDTRTRGTCLQMGLAERLRLGTSL
jgi:2-phospho-L-lactate/phosphoenolpyruvate guanylyltransferase